MADPTSPDYYKQVTQESKEEWERQGHEIDQAVDKVIAAHMNSLIYALEREFGRAIVKQANLGYIEDVLYSLAHSAADKTKSVMIDAHYKETQKSLDSTLEAVLTGIRIGEGAA